MGSTWFDDHDATTLLFFKIGAWMMKMVQLYPNLMSLRGMKN